MCGIVGYIGDKKASDVIVKGLKRLEYRGYDSAGISTFENSSIVTTKCSGKIAELSTRSTWRPDLRGATGGQVMTGGRRHGV